MPTHRCLAEAKRGTATLHIGCLASCLSALSCLFLQAPLRGGTPQKGLDHRILVNKYCGTCHNERANTGGVILDNLNLDDISANAGLFEKIVHKVRAGEMPPPGMPRPDKATFDAFASSLEAALDSAASAKPNPGRVAIHRLNRTEYANAIRDLLALEVDGRSLLVADGVDRNGFDNNWVSP